jgi:hypothetical protein
VVKPPAETEPRGISLKSEIAIIMLSMPEEQKFRTSPPVRVASLPLLLTRR